MTNCGPCFGILPDKKSQRTYWIGSRSAGTCSQTLSLISARRRSALSAPGRSPSVREGLSHASLATVAPYPGHHYNIRQPPSSAVVFCFLPCIFSNTILQLIHSLLACAMCTTIELPIANFHAMPNDLTSAVGALGSQCMDRAFETVEHVCLASQFHFKRFVIVISTDFTRSHCSSFLLHTNLA